MIVKRAQQLERFFKKRAFVQDSPGVRAERLKDGRVQLHARKKKLQPHDVWKYILLWQVNVDGHAGPFVGMSLARSVLEGFGLGLTVRDNTDWSGNVLDYGVIVWLAAVSDPPWWGAIANGSWRGRFHLSAEWYPDFTASINYVNSKSSLHGMTVANNASGAGAPEFALPSSHPLAAGMVHLVQSDTAGVSGGASVFINSYVGPMMQQRKVGNVDWVVAGDSNHLNDEPIITPGPAVQNAQFLRNLIVSFPFS